GFGYFLILNAIQNGMVSSTQGHADLKKLYDMREDQMPWDATNNQPDFTYTYVARLIGGCPGFQSQRQSQTGLAYAFTQESLAELLCAQGAAQHTAPTDGDTSLGNILNHQMQLTLGRDATAQDKADYTAAATACTGSECSPAGLENSVCVGILGSAEMVFY
ncbi:MAG TPA: hypothetical protein VMV18_05600, partial [bacterium]|nr:hypothetical protein [bacterium]